MNTEEFRKAVAEGIPDILPEAKPYDNEINHAPVRKDILSEEEKVLAVRNALRYFPRKHHAVLAEEFARELKTYGRIYMYRFRPDYEMYARPIDMYPAKCRQAAAIMSRAHNIRGQRGRLPELGTVQAGNALPVGNDRHADPRDVLGPSSRTFPEPQGCPEGDCHKRHGHPELFQTG